MDEVIISKKDYDELKEKELWLSCLEAAGVDNWEGYEQAYYILEEFRSEE